MKTTGIVRCIDHLGRVVIPKEMCRVLHISAGDSLEFTLQNRSIIVTKHEAGCIFCGETKGVVQYKGKPVCADCAASISSQS